MKQKKTLPKRKKARKPSLRHDVRTWTLIEELSKLHGVKYENVANEILKAVIGFASEVGEGYGLKRQPLRAIVNLFGEPLEGDPHLPVLWGKDAAKVPELGDEPRPDPKHCIYCDKPADDPLHTAIKLPAEWLK